MPVADLKALTEAISVVAPIDGVAWLKQNSPVQPGWHVVELSIGKLRIDYKAQATPQQITDGDAVALAFDTRPRRARAVDTLETEIQNWIAAGADAQARQLRAARVAARALAVALCINHKLGTGGIPVTPDEPET